MNKIDLRCEICQAKFDISNNIPKVLTCGHTVCSICIERMKEKELNKCPFDRKIIYFDDDKIAINYYILSLIDGSIKESTINLFPDIEEDLKLNPKPVINSPGWKNTLDGFILNQTLYTVESNGFIYCTDLYTGEWWFLFLNQFYGKFFFNTDKKMFIIDIYGNLYHVTNKNYYSQLGKKNSWRETTHITIFNNKLYSVESSNKFYETDLETGKWKQIGKSKKKKDINNLMLDMDEINDLCKNFEGITTLLSSDSNIFMSNDKGEFFLVDESTGDLVLLKNNFCKMIDLYTYNSNHLYFTERNKKSIFRISLKIRSIPEIIEKLEIGTKEGIISYSEVEKVFDMDESTIPIKLISDNEKLIIFDKCGDIKIVELINKKIKDFQCLFMLRNCHYQNTSLMGDGDLLILDPVRLSINKLNIISGTEVIILHSLKFIYSIKTMFTSNLKIYFIDINGCLYFFNESEKKVNLIGNHGICKYINFFAVHRNYLFTVENGLLFRTNLNDGNYIEINNDNNNLNCIFFFADNVNLIFINKNDEILIYTTFDNSLKLKKKFNFPGFNNNTSVTYFKNHIIYYNNEFKNIEAFSIDNDELLVKVMIQNFPNVSFFINNNDILACILNDGVIYKLYC